jgi:hypothetical protein
MRPVALPFTGGLLSTLLLFALLMPTLSFSHQSGGYEFITVPRGHNVVVTNAWGQEASPDAEDFPLFASPDEPNSDYVNIVNFTIDQNGKVVDWAIVRGTLTDEMKSIILLGKFDPATVYGMKTSGIIQVRQSLPPCKYMQCTNSNSVTVHG